MTGGERGVYDPACQREQQYAADLAGATLIWVASSTAPCHKGRTRSRSSTAPSLFPAPRSCTPMRRTKRSGPHRHVVDLPRRGTAGAHCPVLRDAVDARVHADRVHRPRRRDGTEDQPRPRALVRRCCATDRSTSTRSSRQAVLAGIAEPDSDAEAFRPAVPLDLRARLMHDPDTRRRRKPHASTAAELRAISEVAGSLSR